MSAAGCEEDAADSPPPPALLGPLPRTEEALTCAHVMPLVSPLIAFPVSCVQPSTPLVERELLLLHTSTWQPVSEMAVFIAQVWGDNGMTRF